MRSSVVDLFCGVGGMTHGFIKEGFRVVAGIDADPSCKFAYESNNGATFLQRDISTLQSSEIETLYPASGFRLLIGCAPCQPFSLYTNRKGSDEKWRLLHSFAKLATTLEPDVLSMENVPLLERHTVFDQFVKALEDADYIVTYFVARAEDYGIPQRRNRLVLFASRLGPIDLIEPTHDAAKPVTLKHAIGHLPAIDAGAICPTDPLHRSRALTPMNLRRIRATRAGGGWQDWAEELRLPCHRKDKGKTFRSVYGRMSWDKPASVITTQCIGIGNGRFGHPDQDRAISLREAALIQTFPTDYRFLDPMQKRVSAAAIARQIGNAVPVTLGRVIARSIYRHLEENGG